MNINNVKDRIKYLIEKLMNSYKNPNIQGSLGELLEALKNNSLIVMEPSKVSASLERAQMANLKWLFCPECGYIKTVNSITLNRSELTCVKCGANLVQGYIGAPIDDNFEGYLHRLDISESGSVSRSEYLVKPMGELSFKVPNQKDAIQLKKLYCEVHKDKKEYIGIKARNNERPLASLAASCPYKESTCKYYKNGWCGLVQGIPFFKKMRGNIPIVLSPPSYGITKPLSITVFTYDPNKAEDITENLSDAFKRNNKYNQYFDKVLYLEHVKIYTITPMFLVGHPYSGNYKRIPVILRDDNDRIVALGRKMDTQGVLFVINKDNFKKPAEEKQDKVFEVAHSVSHVIQRALVTLTGLSPQEFGESIYEDAQQVEILAFDDSPGGIGAVKSVRDHADSFVMHLLNSSKPCVRNCLSACKACLFIENCYMLNRGLSWRYATRYFS